MQVQDSIEVSIICVNWNSVDYLMECLPTIYEFTRNVKFEVIIVDNASPDGKAELLKERFPEISLIKSSKNLGFAGANNLGFLHSSGKYILFLNPDTKLINPAIEIMLRQMLTLPDAGIVGCKLLNGDLSVQTSCIMRFPRILNQFVQAEYLRLKFPRLWGIGPLFSDEPAPAPAEAISGACMLVRRKVFEGIGMFSEDYFMYAEDLDLCYKAIHAGFRNYYVGEATIIHYAGKSSAPVWQTVMKLKSELRFCAKHYGRLYERIFRIALAANAIVRLPLIAALSLLKTDPQTKMSLASSSEKWMIVIKTLFIPLPPTEAFGKDTSDCCETRV